MELRNGSHNISTRTINLILILTIFSFLVGVTIQKYKYFPYYQLAGVIKLVGTPLSSYPQEILMRQYFKDETPISLDRHIDTALLPLQIQGIRVSEHFPMPKTGGAITSIANNVIVLDRMGNIYSWDSNTINKLIFPPIPNHVDSYLKHPSSLIDTKTFRAYDIEYSDAAKLLAVSHEYFDTKFDKTRMAVSIIGIDEQTLSPIGSWETIFQGDLEPDGSNDASDGRMVWKTSKILLLTIGDYLIKIPKVAQDMNSKFGKIFEINIETKASKIFSVGHRNPQGLLLASSGDLFSTEHGPAGGDELNEITEGSNYGWPIVSLGTTKYEAYSWQNDSPVGEHAGYQAPIFAWVPSIAVSNLMQVRGFHRRWDGDFLIGSLKGLSIYRIRMNRNSVLYSEPIWIGQRIRDMTQLKDGTIVLWTDDAQLLFITVDEPQLQSDIRPSHKSISDTLDQACMWCHHFGSTNTSDFAPSLSNLYGRKIAADKFRYSVGLRSKEGTWTEEKLREFLSNPDKFANGTGMPVLNLGQEAIDEIVQTLKQY
jgi:cytochrome c2